MNIRLHIDCLVLEGINLTKGQQALLKAACEARLSHLLAQGGIATDLTRAADATGAPSAPITAANLADTSLLGGQIAQSVYGRIKP